MCFYPILLHYMQDTFVGRLIVNKVIKSLTWNFYNFLQFILLILQQLITLIPKNSLAKL